MSVTNRRNVFIVGAGASTDFGLPTGADLQDYIKSLLNFSYDDSTTGLIAGHKDIFHAIEQLVTSKSDIQSLLQKASLIKKKHSFCSLYR